MLTIHPSLVALYVDRATEQWVVRDAQGDYWIVPSVDDGWNQRQPLELTEELELESVPTHYKYLLNLPF